MGRWKNVSWVIGAYLKKFHIHKCFSQFFLNGSLGHFFVSEMLAPMFNAAAPWFLNSNIREWTWHNKMKKIGDNNFSMHLRFQMVFWIRKTIGWNWKIKISCWEWFWPHNMAWHPNIQNEKRIQFKWYMFVGVFWKRQQCKNKYWLHWKQNKWP